MPEAIQNRPVSQRPAGKHLASAALVRESDNRFMNFALFVGSGVHGLPGLSRGLWRYYGQDHAAAVRRFFQEYRPHPLPFVGAAVILFLGVNFVQTHTIATGVVLGGQYVGAVDSRETVENARIFMEDSASEALGYEYSLSSDFLRTHPVVVANNALLTQDQVVNMICDANPIVTHAYVLTVDGQVVTGSGSQFLIENVLKQKLTQYRTENTISAEFCEDVCVSREIVSESERKSFGSVTETVNSTSQEEVIYTVKTGDTWSQIAGSFDMSSAELLALNPEYDMDKIWVNQELTVSAAVPLLNVRTVDREKYRTAVPYETEWQNDDTMYQGETRLITAGVEGTADVEANVTYLNGVETNRDVIDSVMVTAPVTRVMAVGTKERPKTMASGSFAWPTSGRLSSTFGGRASPGGIGSRNHKGIDIAGSRGRAIKASDGGTVSYSGWMGGYGYLVIIDHGNGYQTYYGHNSKLLVGVGDKVYKGQQIANMGSTGNSTGNHCHFEIRLHGTPVNPLKYL